MLYIAGVGKCLNAVLFGVEDHGIVQFNKYCLNE